MENRQPSFLLNGSLLVIGEVDRTTGWFEQGLHGHEMFRGGHWVPGPLIYDQR